MESPQNGAERSGIRSPIDANGMASSQGARRLCAKESAPFAVSESLPL